MWCRHRDAAWTYPPFSGRTDERYVHGRGSTDMKGGCASILAACEALVNRDRTIPATLALSAMRRPAGRTGSAASLQTSLISPADCLIAEPTPCPASQLSGRKGSAGWRWSSPVRLAHGSLYPAVGVSAIMEAMALLGYVKGCMTGITRSMQHLERDSLHVPPVCWKRNLESQDVSDILRKLTYNPGTLSRGGEKSNVVAEHCILELEMRVPVGMCRSLN